MRRDCSTGSIAFGMRRFLTPDANRLILRHFHLGSQILRFIADNATPGFRPELEPMAPRRPRTCATMSSSSTTSTSSTT